MARPLALLSFCAVLSFSGSALTGYAQETTTPPAAPASQEPAPAPQADAATAPANGPVKPGYVKNAKGKEEWVGSNEIVVLAPKPMLDEEGKQRQDPDGKLMFFPPVKQQRDKKGHPLFDEKGAPVMQTATELGYDEHGKHLKSEKVKPPKTTPVSIARGTFTVDGVIAKAGMNYEIADLKYIYLFVPGAGVTVVSDDPFPGATLQKDAFSGKTLTVKANDHTLQLASDKKLMPTIKDKKPMPAYVLVDRNFQLPTPYPQVGYGTVVHAPYQWPGSKANVALKDASTAPPVPKNLQPVQLLSSCPAGQMRMPAPPALPGQKVPDQPCVPIEKAEAARKALEASKLTPSTHPTP